MTNTFTAQQRTLARSKSKTSEKAIIAKSALKNKTGDQMHNKSILSSALFLAVALCVAPNSKAHATNSCEAVLSEVRSSENMLDKNARPRLKATRQLFTLNDFFNPDPSKNLAVLHPSSVLSAPQVLYRVIHSLPSRTILDPEYRTHRVKVYPVFHGEHELLKDSLIVGQYEAISDLVDSITMLASGGKGGKVPLLVGPGGTGKTEMATVLTKIESQLAQKDPEFFRYTYEWVGLENIPSNRPLVTNLGDSSKALVLRAQTNDSPFTLLRHDLQDEVMQISHKAIEAKVGIAPNAWRHPNPRDQKILESIFEYEYPEIAEGHNSINDLTREQYLAVLSKYVRVVRNELPFSESQPTAIIRNKGENPDYSKLIADTDLRLRLYYKTDDARLYNFNGELLKSSHGIYVFDEYFRNPIELLEKTLELFQNHTIEGDSLPVKLDAVGMLTSNDESVEKAKKKGAIAAVLSRLKVIETPWNIHPYQIAKAALVSQGLNTFYMRPLEHEEGTTSDWKPIDINQVYTEPMRADTTERILGPDGRFQVGCNYKGQRILIAPRTLEMLGLVASASRLSVEPEKMEQYWNELNVISANTNYYVNVKSRLDVIMGNVDPETALRAELYKVKTLTKEGHTGMGSRPVMEWLERALALASETPTRTLTPRILDRALEEMAKDPKALGLEGITRANFLLRWKLVKMEFVLPELLKDVERIATGDGHRAERIYDEVVSDMIALSSNKDATHYTPDDGGNQVVIRHDRLNEVKAIYKQLYNKELVDGVIMVHLKNSRGSAKVSRSPELLAAITKWLMQRDSSVSETITQIVNYYDGKAEPSRELERKIENIHNRLYAFGYDEASFKDVLFFIQQLQTSNKQNVNPIR